MADEPRVKVTLVTSTMTYIRNTLGEPALRGILATMDSKELTAERGLLPSDRVLERTYHDLLVGAGKALASTPGSRPPKEYFFEMGRFLAKDGVNKYYQSLIRMFDIKFMLTKSPHIWGLVHSHGMVKIEPVGKNGVYVYIVDYPWPCKEFCYMMRGYIWAVGELTKAEILGLEEQECVMEGAKWCKYFGRWKA